ncbi:DNA mismatch repair endonuclease MutL [Ammoniphilus sp. CFH 90114]|uniref:DNA mismatch repair endonuclease MutL n=1 Tax=Ammoniphilus sp. CFH 90114 TaxID=2493665 RepID=UPI00100E6465|nr:DNA mismatch repair endonuclease MutL [Ammoniphilus sp. CFH 90114]RXT15203.1 DNA mismatch repair endonuclease MutL [Ammoniphilus sp. CFH 90114]
MGVIQVLDDRLANMIAAGEVVERPASVVKELVENAIDAGSKRIEVHVKEGGLSLIQVIDDGCGMAVQDCELCFERHATSKIKRDRDLFHISTLGFRGEALPSIAAVARVELKSCRETGQAGTRIILEGGEKKTVESVAQPKGTDIMVKDLFFNTPARLKYLKSIQTELGHISDYMNRLAFSYPSISFLLTSDGKTLFKTYGDGQLQHVIAAVYGMPIAKEMEHLQASNLDFQLEGYFGNPQITRANRSYITLLINGRYIRNHALINAILRGYHTLLPINRYPIAILNIRLEPTLIDVNVHPAKLEVRLSKEQELLAFVEEEVKKIWGRQRLIPEPTRSKAVEDTAQTRLDLSRTPASYIQEPREKERFYQRAEDAETTMKYTEWLLRSAEEKEEQNEQGQKLPQVVDSPPTPTPAVPEFYPLAQLHGSYILAQSEEGLYIIDQHAAQERIWYEYFLNKLSEEQIELQDLLIPLSIHLSVKEMKQVQEKMNLFNQVGLEMEPFGNQTFLVRSHPRWFIQGEEEATIHEMVEMIIRGETKIDTVKLREKAAIMMSCKAAIKANRYLSHIEMEALLDKLRETISPYTCPHGRPIIIHFSKYEIEKMFKRVM